MLVGNFILRVPICLDIHMVSKARQVIVGDGGQVVILAGGPLLVLKVV